MPTRHWLTRDADLPAAGRVPYRLLELGAEHSASDRFIAVPQLDSHEGYRDMEHFIATVREPHLRELLDVAITGRGAFRRFKDVLLGYPAERERWFAFKDARMIERVQEWLADQDIELIDEGGTEDA